MTKQKKIYFSVVALILAAVFGFVCLNSMLEGIVQASASESEYAVQEETELVSQLTPERQSRRQTPTEAYILSEDISQRGRYTRYFFMSDGTMTRETFAEPIHFANEQGVYQIIDNSFVSSAARDGIETVTNASNAFEAEFSVDPNAAAPIASITYGETSLQFFPAESIGAESAGVIADNSRQERQYTPLGRIASEYLHQENQSLDFNYRTNRRTVGEITASTRSGIYFPEAMPATDRHFDVTPYGIVEHLIIHSPLENHSFQFAIRAEGLELFNIRGEEIWAYSGIKRVFEINNAFMQDAVGELKTNGITYGLEALEDYNYLLTITACHDWLNAGERAFPVRVDTMSVGVTPLTANNDPLGLRAARVSRTNSQIMFGRAGILSSETLVVRYNSNISLNRRLIFDIESTSSRTRSILGELNPQHYLALEDFRDPVFRLGRVYGFRDIRSGETLTGESIDNFERYSDGTFTVAFGFSGGNSRMYFSNMRVAATLAVTRDQIRQLTFAGQNFAAELDVIDNSQRAVVPYFIQHGVIMPIQVFGVYNQGFSARRLSAITASTLNPPSTVFYGHDWKLNIQQYMLPIVTSGQREFIHIDESGDFHLFTRRGDGLYRAETSALQYNPNLSTLGTPLHPNMLWFNTLGKLYRIYHPDGHRKRIFFASGRINHIVNYVRRGQETHSVSMVEFFYTNNRLSSLRFGEQTSLVTSITYDPIGRVNTVSNNLLSNRKSVSITYTNSTTGNLLSIRCTANNGQGYRFIFNTANISIRETFYGIDNPNWRKQVSGSGNTRHADYYERINNTDRRLYRDSITFEGNVTAIQRVFDERDGVRPPTQTTEIYRCRNCEECGSHPLHNTDSTRVTQTDGESRVVTRTVTNRNAHGALVYQEITSTAYHNNIPIERHTQFIDNLGRLEYERHRTLRDETVIGYTYDSNVRHRLTRIGQSCGNDIPRATIVISDFNGIGLGERITHNTFEVTNTFPNIRIGRSRAESFRYDGYGQVTRHTNADGVTHHYMTGWLGNTRNRGVVMSNGDMETVVYSYSAQGVLTGIEVMCNWFWGVRIQQTVTITSDSDRFTIGSGGGAIAQTVNYSGGNWFYITRTAGGTEQIIQRFNFERGSWDYTPSQNITSITFANNHRMEYEYNSFGQMIGKSSFAVNTVSATPNLTFSYEYNGDGELSRVSWDGGMSRDFTRSGNTHAKTTTGLMRSFGVTSTFNPSNTSINNTAGNWTVLTGIYTLGNVQRHFWISETRGFNGNNRDITIADGSFVTSYNFDRGERLNSFTNSTSGVSKERSFGYATHSDRVKSVTDVITIGSQQRTVTTGIGYDGSGNIVSLFGSRETVEFMYDGLGRLIWEECHVSGRVFEYEYDDRNNLRRVWEQNENGTFTTTFTHNGDRLTGITSNNPAIGNHTLTFDGMGNPTRHRHWNMEWTRGRLLSRLVPSANWPNAVSFEFRYDENGIRYRKTERGHVSGIVQNTTDFFADGTRIIAEESTRYGLIEYFYDGMGVIGMRRGGIDFFFVRDVLGNIVEVIRVTDGVTVAAYRYDAWGNTTVLINIDNMAHINPWRYRGKYTDRATGFIYMQTRYYDPVVRRFINPDNYMLLPLLAMTGELNMQAYVMNNPIMYVDPTGQSILFGIFIAFIVVGAAIGGTYQGVTAYNQGARGWELAGAITQGIVIGAALGAAVFGFCMFFVAGGAAILSVKAFGLTTLALFQIAGITAVGGLVAGGIGTGAFIGGRAAWEDTLKLWGLK